MFKIKILRSLKKLSKKLDEVLELLEEIFSKENVMSVELDNLKVQVENTTTVEQSAIALIQGLAVQIEAMKTDPVALQSLSDELKGKADALSAAVAANTTTNVSTTP